MLLLLFFIVYLLFWGCLFVSLFIQHLILADLRFVFRHNLLHLLYYRHVVVGVRYLEQFVFILLGFFIIVLMHFDIWSNSSSFFLASS